MTNVANSVDVELDSLQDCSFRYVFSLSLFTYSVEIYFFPMHVGEQYTYKCLSCPFSSMTISQLKEHSLTDHGEALTLTKLRAATQAAHAAPRAPRLATNTEQTTLAPDGNYVILLNHVTSPRFGDGKKKPTQPKAGGSV